MLVGRWSRELTLGEAMLLRSCRFGGHVQLRGSNLASAFLRLRKIVFELVRIGYVVRSSEDQVIELRLHRIVRNSQQL